LILCKTRNNRRLKVTDNSNFYFILIHYPKKMFLTSWKFWERVSLFFVILVQTYAFLTKICQVHALKTKYVLLLLKIKLMIVYWNVNFEFESVGLNLLLKLFSTRNLAVVFRQDMLHIVIIWYNVSRGTQGQTFRGGYIRKILKLATSTKIFYNLCLKTMFFYVVSSKFLINLQKSLTSNIFLDPQVGDNSPPPSPPLRMYKCEHNLDS